VLGGRAVRDDRRFLARRRATIIWLPLKVSNEIIGDVDLADRFMAVLQEDVDSFDRSANPAIKLAVKAAKPLKLGLGAVGLLGKICICGLR